MEIKRYEGLIFKFPLLILAFIISFCFCVGAVNADNSHLYVNTHGDDTWNGESPVYNSTTGNGPKATVKDAAANVAADGTINVAKGTYAEHGITVTSSMMIVGKNQRNTIIDGQQNQIFHVNPNVSLTLVNLTLKNAFDVHGGAIVNYGNLTLINCTFYNNTAIFDGAIYNYVGGIVTIENCKFTKNNASYDAGAIYNDFGSILRIKNSAFINNIAGTDGGAVNNRGSLYIEGTLFKNNVADVNNIIDIFHGPIHFNANGGAITNAGTCNVNNSTFADNSATNYGGALSNWNIATLINTRIYNNTANENGGAVNNYGTLNINYSRIVGNNAPNGSAMFNQGTMNVPLNWWGSNLDPKTVPNLMVGVVNAENWVILSISADPKTIYNGQKSIVKVDFNHINRIDGVQPLVGGHIPEGPLILNIPWGSFINGTLVHTTTGNTENGILIRNFYANQGQVTLLYNPVKITASADGYTTNNAESAYIKIIRFSKIFISKTGPKTVVAGNKIKYSIIIMNYGPDPAENVVVVDNVPKILENVVHDSFNIGTLLPGESRIINITGTVPGDTYNGKVMVNSATATSDTSGIITPSGKVLTTVKTLSKLEMIKTVDKAWANVNEIVKFTVTLTNSGPSDAVNLMVKDIMPKGFSNVMISCSDGSFSGGFWKINLERGKTAILNLSGTVTSQMAGKNTTNFVRLVNTGESASATVYVPRSELYLIVTSNNYHPSTGELFKLTYKLGNRGPDASGRVVIKIPLPKNFELSNITGDGLWNYINNTNTIIWTLKSVPVGDPKLFVSGRSMKPGIYTFGTSLSPETVQINVKGQPETKNVVEGKTIEMQNTGAPIVPLAVAIIYIFAGIAWNRRK